MPFERVTNEELSQEIRVITERLEGFCPDDVTARRAFVKANPDQRKKVLQLTERRQHLRRMMSRNTERSELESLRTLVGEKDTIASQAGRDAATAQNQLEAARREHRATVLNLEAEIKGARRQRNIFAGGFILAVAISLLAEAV